MEIRDPYRDIPLGVECAWPQGASYAREASGDERGRDVVLRSGQSVTLERPGLATS